MGAGAVKYSVGLDGKLFDTSEEAEEALKKQQAEELAREGAAIAASAEAAASAAKPTATNTPFKNRRALLLLIMLALLAGYYLLNKAGLKNIWSVGIAGGIAVLLVLIILAPSPAKFVWRLLGIIAITAGGLLGFFALALLPFQVPAFFTTIFILGTIAIAFAEWGKGAGITLLLVNALLFFILLGPWHSKLHYTEAFRIDSPLYLAAEKQQAEFAKIWESRVKVKQGATGVQQDIKRRILVATGEYEDGVEAATSEPLGVFLEKTAVTRERVTIGTPIDLFTELTAQTFGFSDETLKIKLQCYGKTFSGNKIEGSNGDITPQAEFELADLESYPVDCVLNSEKFGVGPAKAVIEAEFDFTTSSFIKGHFMPQEIIRDYARQKKQPLTELGISGRDLEAVYTAGPLRIGMGLGRQPIPILPNTPFAPTLGITFENNWVQGKFVEFKKLTITAPPGIEMIGIDGQKILKNCKTIQKEQTCTMEEKDLEEMFKDKIFTRTIRVQTQGRSAEELLQGAPLAIRSFKLSVDYVYQISKEIDVTVLPIQ